MTELQALIDERELMRGLSTFARILDDKRWDDLGEVFADDLTFNYGAGGEQAGLAALRANMRRYLDVCGPTQHLIGSVMAEVLGDQARTRAYVQARHQRAGQAAGPVFDSNGEYLDQWERRPEGWRIVRREAVWLMHSGDPGVLAVDTVGLG